MRAVESAFSEALTHAFAPTPANDHIPPPANDTERAAVGPRIVRAHGVEFDEHDLPPFDPPDENDDIFGSADDTDFVEVPQTAEALFEPEAELAFEPREPKPEPELALEVEPASEEEPTLEAADPRVGDAERPHPDEDMLAAEEAAAEAFVPELVPATVDEAEDAFATDVQEPEPAPAPPAESAPLELTEDIPFDPPDDEPESEFRAAPLAPLTEQPEELVLRAEPAQPPPKIPLSRLSEPDAPSQPAPPISVYASWDRPDIADTLAAFAGDLRLARADIVVERGGLESAVRRCAGGVAPDLVIVDTALAGAAMLAGLDRLQPVIEKGTKLVVLGAVNDITLLRELAARGVSEYIVPPADCENLVRLVCGYFAETDKSHVIAVIGARGGVGASTLAYNIAWSIAERQQAGAALVDLDLSFGSAGFAFDASGSVADLLEASDNLDRVVDSITLQRTPRLRMLTAPATLHQVYEPNADALELAINSVRRTSPYVVLDLPHAWNTTVRRALYAANEVVIVATPDLASLRNTDQFLKILKGGRAEPMVVLSMAGVPKRPEISVKDFTEALSSAPVAKFAFEPELFGVCALSGAALGEVAPRAKAALMIDQLATALTGREVVAPARGKKALPKGPTPVVQVPAACKPAPLTVAAPPPEATSAPEPAARVEIAANECVESAPVEEAAAHEEAASQLELPEPVETEPQVEVEVTAEAAPHVEPSEAAEPTLAPVESASPQVEAAPEARPAQQPKQPPRRRRSSGLIRMAAAFIAAIVLTARFVEHRRQNAEAAEPVTIAAAPAPIAVPQPALNQPERYQQALDAIAAGAADNGVSQLRRLADEGFVMAQYRLSKVYEQGADADLRLARAWTERAANAGNVQAMHDLGVFYSRDETAPRDEAAAFRWFRQAADYDLADSQFNLGILYQQGRGVTADASEALFWFMLAARHGDDGARQRVAELEAQLTPMQIEQAAARAQAFHPRARDPVANGVFAEPTSPPAAAATPAPETAQTREAAAVEPTSDVTPTPAAAPEAEAAAQPTPN